MSRASDTGVQPEDTAALGTYLRELGRLAPLTPERLLEQARALAERRAFFVAAALAQPATVAAILARWRRLRGAGRSTGTLSAHHAERDAGDPSTQVDRALERVERLVARRGGAARGEATRFDSRIADAVTRAQLAFDVIAAAFHEGLRAGGRRSRERQPAIADALATLAAYHSLRGRLVEHNLRLVVAFARIYRGMGVSLPDLVQEGNVGLIRAVERFDPERGSRFSTYAAWWIHQAMIRAIQRHSRTVRVPSHVFDLQRRYRRVEDELRAERAGDPARSDVASRLGLEPGPVDMLHSTMAPIVSTHAARAGDESSLDDSLAADPGEWPAAGLDHAHLARALASALPELPVRERIVLELRFGLAGAEEQTLQEVGRHLGLSRERVRQIESRALTRLRKRPAVVRVASLLDGPAGERRAAARGYRAARRSVFEGDSPKSAS